MYINSICKLCAQLCLTLGSLMTAAFQASDLLFCRFLLQGIFPTQGSKWFLRSPAQVSWQADILPLVPPGKPHIYTIYTIYTIVCVCVCIYIYIYMYTIYTIYTIYTTYFQTIQM